MTMPGGGVFSLLKGQFTDDSEMASHLLSGLHDIDPKVPLEDQHFKILRKISNEYIEWLESKPFDMGITCRKGILKLK